MAALIVSCNSNKQDPEDEMPALYPAPKSVKLNLQEGYVINPVTGDSIQPIINSFGDTVKTGVTIPAKGRVIHPDSVAQPMKIPVGTPKVVPAKKNVHKVPENLTVIPVNKDLLKSYTPGVDIYQPFILVNSIGDTIPTGVPIPAKGEVVLSIQPKPVKALLPRMKDNASININYMDVEHGMNSSYVTSTLEDHHGNLWLGTEEGGGVNKYNGSTFMHFTEKEGLSNNWVNFIMEDSHGNLWFGTGNLWFGTDGGGVCMYNGKTFTHFTEKEGISDNSISSILEDRQGNLWFCTRSRGVSMYNGESLTHFTTNEGLSNNNVRCILEDRHGNLWFGTNGGGVSKYNRECFTHFTKNEGLSDNWVNSILEDSQGNLWFGTQGGGVSMYNGESFTYFTENEGLSDNWVQTILEDRHGNLWFGTLRGGVNKYDGESFTHFTKTEGLSEDKVASSLKDSHGNLWFGTDGGGVCMYNDKTFTYITPKEGLIQHSIRPILEDGHGNLWFGSIGGEVSMYNGKTYTYYTQKEGLSGNNVRCLLEDRHGNLWVGHTRGLCKYDGRTFTHFTKKEGLSGNSVWSVLEDHHGNLWFGTEGGGVSKYNGESFTHFTEKEGLSDNWINSILEDSYGNLWFGTNGGGVCKYNGESFTHFTEKEGLSNNTILSILEDSHGNLWFGTEGGGVSKYNGESFTHFTEKEGLSNNYVLSILEDGDSNIWLSTAMGLNCILFDPESISNSNNTLFASGVKGDSAKHDFHNPVIQTFSIQEGLKSVYFYHNSVLLDSKNRIWWGSDKGLTMLDMNNFKIATDPPSNMNLNRIEINDQFVDYRNLDDSAHVKMEFDSVPRFYNYPLNLKLPYKQNQLTFYFSAIDWSAPHKIKYSYKMEGLRNDDWSIPTAEAKADYRSLPHGNFTFQVRAIGAAQKWSEAFEYSFTIRPPWWYSWWAYCIYGFIIILIIRQYRRYLLNRAKLQTEVEIERIEKEKVLELDHMRSRFFANISHEFRTPLTLLLGPLEDGLKISSSKIETDRGVFEMMKRNAKRLQRLINQLLDLSKLETGKIKLQVSEGNLTEFVRTIVLSFLSLAESKKIKYEYELPEISGPVYFDQDKLEKILTNLVSNAFKFTSPEGKIKVKLNYPMEEGKDAPALC